MQEKQYTENHEWIAKNEDHYFVGISAHAIDELGELVFIDIQPVGNAVQKDEEFASVESVKTVSGVYAPASGEITEVNSDLIDHPEQLNNEDQWLVQLRLDSEAELEDSAHPEA